MEEKPATSEEIFAGLKPKDAIRLLEVSHFDAMERVDQSVIRHRLPQGFYERGAINQSDQANFRRTQEFGDYILSNDSFNSYMQSAIGLHPNKTEQVKVLLIHPSGSDITKWTQGQAPDGCT